MGFHVRHSVREYLMGRMVFDGRGDTRSEDSDEPVAQFHAPLRRLRRRELIASMRHGDAG